MGAALHAIRAEHFKLCFMLRRLLALAEGLEPSNRQDLSGPIALILRYLDRRNARGARASPEMLLREALYCRGIDAAPKGKIVPIEPRIRSRLLFQLSEACAAVADDGSQLYRVRAAANAYGEFERWCMVQFETRVLPLALSALGPDDWGKVDAEVLRFRAATAATRQEIDAERLFREALRSGCAKRRSAVLCHDRSGGRSADHGPRRRRSGFLSRP